MVKRSRVLEEITVNQKKVLLCVKKDYFGGQKRNKKFVSLVVGSDIHTEFNVKTKGFNLENKSLSRNMKIN